MKRFIKLKNEFKKISDSRKAIYKIVKQEKINKNMLEEYIMSDCIRLLNNNLMKDINNMHDRIEVYINNQQGSKI